MILSFSSIAAPTWSLDTLLTKAKTIGYGGLELRGLAGQLHLPLAPELAADPAATRARFAEAGVQLVCLSSSAAFHMRDQHAVADNKAQVREYIELAGALGCPYVRVFGAEVPRRALLGYERRDRVLARIAAALRDLAPVAEQHRVTLVVENSGDFCGSADLWFLVDAAASPAVRACWNTLAGRSVRERPTTSVTRLGSKIALVHACDGKFTPQGQFEGHVLPGQGDCELPRLFELLKGVGFAGPLVFDWPKLWNTALAEADKSLPEAAKFFRSLLDQKPVVLTAYKGDKNAPKFRPRAQGAAV